MKKILLAAVLFILGSSAFSQSYYTIYGKVMNGETNQPMPGASVFAQNTTLGTATDESGNFRLSLPDGGYSLVITFTGFQTESMRISNADANNHNLSFTMNPRQKQMEEVAVIATSEVKDGWIKYGNFFLEKFIGQSANATQTKILNPEVLKFYFSKKKNRLKVLAQEALRIENAALGYNIIYALDSFVHEYNTQASLYTGYPLFQEMTAAGSDQLMGWMQARQEAYKGSILHFMRSLYNKTLQQEGFEVQFIVQNEGRDTAIALKDAYGALHFLKDDSTSIVEMQPNQLRVGVIYLKEKPSAAYLIANEGEPEDFEFSMLGFLPGESIGIEKNGYYFEQNDLSVSAYWSWERMADQLPYNYAPVSE